MRKHKAITRYAKTLFNIAKQKGAFEKVLRDMNIILNVFKRTEKLESFFTNPLIKDQDLNRVISAGFSNRLCPPTISFIKLLQKKKRLDLLKNIPTVFTDLFEEHKNIIRVTVNSTQKLSKPQLAKIEEKLRQRYDAESFIIENIIDRNLIAGIQIRIGDTIIDSNIKNKLHQLKKKLAA